MTQNRIPASVLFCCDHNSIRSPIAEGMMKKFYGRAAYVQSAGVKNDMEVDGFAIAVCDEIGVKIENHRSRSFDEMKDWGDTGRSWTPPAWPKGARPSSPPIGRPATRSRHA